MREAAFIQRNQAKWQRLEQAVTGLDKLSGDEASDLYIQLTDDLGYAQTFYPKSKITTYLNGLAVRLHQHIYRNQRVPRKRFLTFWSHEVPLAIAAARTNLLYSSIVFVVAMAIGAISAKHDPTFIRLIMGDEYVDMTLENIRNGDPMGVYDSMDEGGMFVLITLNNIKVSFFVFIAGMCTTLLPGLLLLVNGIMLGSFQYFLFKEGVLTESLLTIWIHGTIEISSIVVAGAAGFALGNGLLFPGTYSRGASFRHGARIGLKVAVGLVPLFIVAGFLESFVTRHSLEVRPWVAVSVIGLSLVWVIYYFIILPYHAERRAGAIAPGP
ncbi:MAG: stage II sporulation protein M [Flavobacteriales bacterium]|nr:stage II sporulation protein M [Flavobacteriales bacterium]